MFVKMRDKWLHISSIRRVQILLASVNIVTAIFLFYGALEMLIGGFYSPLSSLLLGFTIPVIIALPGIGLLLGGKYFRWCMLLSLIFVLIGFFLLRIR